jgi:hypothetical protein
MNYQIEETLLWMKLKILKMKKRYLEEENTNTVSKALLNFHGLLI